ncbi:MAG TPA: ADOP family duplicated permease [Vicinamibacterales bacterium]|nr:ADOP family duplicated permease [Vicinamibacterales bacterium]
MPPRLAIWLLAQALPADEREFALGDLAEEFADRATHDGYTRARRWYWRQAIRSSFTRRPRRYGQVARPSRTRPMTHLLQDARFSLRLLKRAPGFTAVIITTLALGIGATTAIFSVVHAALLKPLPFKDPQGLVVPTNGSSVADSMPLNYPQLLQWRDDFGVFDEVAGYFNWSATLRDSGDAERLAGIRSTASLFSVLGVQPVVGSLFTRADEARSAEPIVLISEALWKRKYAADRSIPGRRIILNDQTFTIVGVLPAWFRGVGPTTDPVDVFGPLRLTEQNAPASLNFLGTVARLKPGQSNVMAQEQLQAAVLRANPDVQPRPRVVVFPFRDRLVRDSRAVLLSLMVAVGFLLLITCANLANLLLARGVGRRREIAVRLAVGAGRRRIVSQLLTESVILSAAGGLAGVLVAWLVIRGVSTLPVLAEAGIYDLSVNWTVLGFGFTLSFVVGIVFGIMPALRAGRASVTRDLRDGARVAFGRDRLRSSFVVLEIALTLMLLAGAGLLGRSMASLLAVDKGFTGDSVLTFRLSTSQAKYPNSTEQTRYFEQVLDRLARVPGVASAGLASELPMAGSDTNGGLTIEGRTFAPGEAPMSQKRIVSPAYFETLGIQVREGRTFADSDDGKAQAVMVVSEAFARRWFPNESAVGKRVGFNWDMDGFQTVIGVVADVKHNGLDDPDNPAVYVSFKQRPDSSFDVAVKSTVPPETLITAVRAELKAIDPDRPMTNVHTMTSLLSESVGGRRLSLNLVGGFALIGLLLAATGIYGVVSHATEQRTREFGIRLALGAESASVLSLVLRQGLLLAAIGAAVGLIGALAIGGVLRAQLFGVEPSDPLTLAAVCAGVILVAVVAGYLPARRAVRIDPATILREG